MSINRPEFYNAINNKSDDNCQVDIGELFDEITALYNIVSEDYSSITRLVSETPNAAEFDVEFISEDRANYIYKTMQGQELVIYSRPLQIICWNSDVNPKMVRLAFHALA